MINGDEFECPYYGLLRPLSAEEMAELRASIIARGVVQPVAITPDFKLIDGYHRATVAAELGLRVPYRMEEYAEAKRAAALDLNLCRRHLTPHQLREARASRVQRVGVARSEGESLSTIADREGVSREQVRQDIKAATVKGLTVEPETIKGKDNRTRRAKPTRSKPKPVPAPEPPGEPDDQDEDSADTLSGVDVAEWAERFRVLALLIAQEQDPERIRSYLHAVVYLARQCEQAMQDVGLIRQEAIGSTG